MNDIPKYEAKPRSLILRLCRWLFLVVGAVTVFQSGYFLVMRLVLGRGIAFPSRAEKIGLALVNVIAVVFLCWLLYPLFRRVAARLVRTPDGQPTLVKRALSRVLNKKMVPRYLFCLAVLATLLAAAYAVENWRGKRAWEKCRRELEAKGEVLDWNAYIPAPVPDEQNIFKAPKMAEWFVKGYDAKTGFRTPLKPSKSGEPFALAPHNDTQAGPVLVAEVDVRPSNGPLPPGKADAVLRFDDPAAPEQAARLIRASVGPCAEGAQNYLFLARSLDRIRPVYLVVQADTMPTVKALSEFLPRGPVPHNSSTTYDPKYFQVEKAGSNGFLVSLTAPPPIRAPAEYLALSQPAVPDLDLLRKALERPCARMDSDYQRPFERPMPNFIRLRTVAQILSQRAQCYLLLGQPEAAWHELALIRDMCRMLEAKPGSDCPTLVEAMIDVAITRLYTSIIQDGLRLGVWREPELAAMQKQLGKINFIPLLQRAFQVERAAVCRTFEGAPLPKMLSSYSRMPRGWVYQNMCTVARLNQLTQEICDVPNSLILPRKADEIATQAQTTLNHFTPYAFLASIAIPNFLKATQTMARNQTLANEAFIACGLERYRLAHGQYPETLEALMPQFAEKLPHDIVGGQPLKYHRTADDHLVLYSVGWNEKDDGGVHNKTVTEGDWIWP